MRNLRRPSARLAASLLAMLALAAAPAPPKSTGDTLWYHRNLAKAFFENPSTPDQAVAELRTAFALSQAVTDRINLGLALLRAGQVDQGVAELEHAQRADPSVPHTWFNLGIAALRAGRTDRAIAQLEGMRARVPDEAIAHYNLGVLYRLQDRKDDALASFEAAARWAPDLAGPHFALYNAYRQRGRTAEAERELASFRAAKARQEDAAIPEDLEWSWYSELVDELPDLPDAPAPVDRRPTFEDTRLLAPNPGAKGEAALEGAQGALLVLDADGDRQADLLVRRAGRLSLFPGGATAPAATGLEAITAATAVAAGDFDNDGRTDLAVLAATAPGSVELRLWRNAGQGRFEAVPGVATRGALRVPLWLDFDHDYDLDLLVFADGGGVLLRNQGTAGFVEASERFPFTSGSPRAVAIFDRTPDAPGEDLAVTFADRPGVVFRDLLAGRFRAEDTPALAPGTGELVAGDWNRDGWTDLVTRAADGRVREVVNQRGALLEGRDLGQRSSALVVADLEGFGVPALPPGTDELAVVAADFDGDGRLDLATLMRDGSVHRRRQTSPARTVTVTLEGVRNLLLGPGAEVELRSGSQYQKQRYEGLPLVFGLGARESIDVLRITWANGLVQSETTVAAGARLHLREAQRLAGSCPMIFTWNGERFEFVTDVLGVAPLGAATGDGRFFPVDRDELIQVPPGALVPRDGILEVRVTEELHEVAFLDRIQLLAVDHASALTLLTNDKFKGPPFPEFRLFGITAPVRPRAAWDDAGNDVTDRLLWRDRRYPDQFARNLSGVAARHRLTLDFGPDVAPDNRALLVLEGWVDWADGSTFLGAAQEFPEGLEMPRLEVLDEAGEWVVADADMGLPAGKPKTIVVDLTGRFRSAARQVRITTSLCIYWDEIYLSENTATPDHQQTVLAPVEAELAFRGFSRPTIDPARKQPETFDYQSFVPTPPWNPTPGWYTRYGDVSPLLAAADDRLVVMGSGDEIRLRFAAGDLPPLAPGRTRTYLLAFDGWAKDSDLNTAFSQTVEPLPFRGMSQYPYFAPETYPDDPALRQYRQEWNTRPALRLLRPLHSTSTSTGRPGG